MAGASATAAVFSRLEPAPHYDVSAYHDKKCFPQVLDTTSLKTFVAKNEISDKNGRLLLKRFRNLPAPVYCSMRTK
jgi:hypothetical protein